MKNNSRYTGFAIALAWPETACKQAGAWYDPLLFTLGINKNGYYKVGHAAVLLISTQKQNIHYFDFGRYHAPHGYARVRSAKTDHDLRIKTKVNLSEDSSEILNINEILSELYCNSSTHGDASIYGALTKIDYDASLNYALDLQKREFLPYGPFQINGSNCSRFVSSVIKAGDPSLFTQLKLAFPLTISPTPMWNLWALSSNHSYIKQSELENLYYD